MDKDKILLGLLKRIEQLEQRRIYQRDIAPNEVKQSHVGEGVRYIRDGVTADKPTEGEEPLQGAAIFFDYDTNTLYVWNRRTNAWVSEVLT